MFAVDIPYEQLDEVTHNVVGHLKSLVEERDGYMDVSVLSNLQGYPR